MATPHRMWDLSSLIRDRTQTPHFGRWSFNHWMAGEVPKSLYDLSLRTGPLKQENKQPPNHEIEQCQTYQGYPQYNIFINEAVKILVQKQKCWTYECRVMQMHLAFSHVCHLWIQESRWCKQPFSVYSNCELPSKSALWSNAIFRESFSGVCWMFKTEMTTRVGLRAITLKVCTMTTKSPPKELFTRSHKCTEWESRIETN